MRPLAPGWRGRLWRFTVLIVIPGLICGWLVALWG
jgi:hypothetical protein